ncbi:hypothetical protein [Streptomyces axinellae]|uniref:Uncharacterized protein n=1 Tax=Streptomyces axinellae TaxID=552788 RepID=A0ABP6CUR9_9ACTN
MTSTSTGPGEPGHTGESGHAAGLAALSSSAANEAIRRFVAGRTLWTKAELAELDRLRGQWQRAVRAEVVKAA